MSSLARERGLRWAAVAVGTAAVALAPATVTAVAGLGAPGASASPRALLAGALASQDVAHSGLAESRGSLGLPDVSGLDTTPALLGGTTRTRVWWSSPNAWRVDVLKVTGELGYYGVQYGADPAVVTWDYEAGSLVTEVGQAPARLPRADDLLPAQAVRRLLGHVGLSDQVLALPGRRVAGRDAEGLRVIPGDPRSTIARVDAWVDRSGLPVEVHVVGAGGIDVLSSRYVWLTIGVPPASLLSPPTSPGARREAYVVSDLPPWWRGGRPLPLPSMLAGLQQVQGGIAGASVYGDGLVRIAVQGLSPRRAGRVADQAQRGGAKAIEIAGGTVTLVAAGPLGAAVARPSNGGPGWVIAGLVTGDLLEQAAAELLATPS